MQLRSWRKRSINSVFATLLALVVCGGAVDWGHVGGDDPDCNIVVIHHDHAAHRLSATPLSSSTSDHCYICHSLRLLHIALAGRRERVALNLDAIPFRVVVRFAPSSPFALALSSRGPPFRTL
jgi:hypothetical protein